MELEKIIQDLNQLNFTAIDFETANEQRNSICSVGLVVVRQGKITYKQNHLVKPKELRFTDINKLIHGISEEDVFYPPEFDSVWEQIQRGIDKPVGHFIAQDLIGEPCPRLGVPDGIPPVEADHGRRIGIIGAKRGAGEKGVGWSEGLPAMPKYRCLDVPE